MTRRFGEYARVTAGIRFDRVDSAHVMRRHPVKTGLLLQRRLPRPLVALQVRHAAQIVFQGHRFSLDITLCAVRWYLRYALSSRGVVNILAERAIMVDRSTVHLRSRNAVLNGTVAPKSGHWHRRPSSHSQRRAMILLGHIRKQHRCSLSPAGSIRQRPSSRRIGPRADAHGGSGSEVCDEGSRSEALSQGTRHRKPDIPSSRSSGSLSHVDFPGNIQHGRSPAPRGRPFFLGAARFEMHGIR